MLRIVPNDSNEARACRERNFIEWGHPVLTRETYYERERVLASTTFSQSSLRTWVYALPNGQVVAQCETYNRPVYIKIPGSSRLLKSQAVSVASVFVPPDARGHGYATAMMSELRHRLESEPDVVASNLYSDIGDQFYSRPALGWQVHDPWHWVVDFRKAGYSEVIRKGENASEKSTLIESEQQVEMWLTQDAEREVKRLSTSKEDSLKLMVWMPFTFDCFKWFRCRTEVVATLLGLVRDRNWPLGRRCGSSIMLYFFNLQEKTLFILRARLETWDETELLWKGALKDAKDMGMDKVVWWNPQWPLVKDQIQSSLEEAKQRMEGTLERRTSESLPSLSLFTQKLELETQFKQQNVCWLMNEKYGWV